jgi:hypothetical protein
MVLLLIPNYFTYSSSLTFELNRFVYSANDLLIVNGITNPNDVVKVVLKDPFSEVRVAIQLRSDHEGVFSVSVHKFTIEDSPGFWTITVSTGSGEEVSKTFAFFRSLINLSVNKLIYRPKDNLTISGRVMALIKDEKVKIYVYDPENKLVFHKELTPLQNGSFVTKAFMFDPSDKAGDWRVVAKYYGKQEEISFNYVGGGAKKLSGIEVFGNPLAIRIMDYDFKEITPKSYQGFYIYVKYSNWSIETQKVIVFIQIKDEEGKIFYLGAFAKTVKPNEVADGYLGPASGLPLGRYTVETYIWDFWTNTPLGNIGTLTLWIQE